MNFNPLNLFRLDDRVAIVTGGSKGLGQAMAAALAGTGAHVVIVSRHHDEAQAAAHEIQTGTQRECLAVVADVTKSEDAQRIVAETLAKFGRVDILVNNAGINRRGNSETLDEATFREVMDTNLVGPWLLCKAVAVPMKQQRWGPLVTS